MDFQTAGIEIDFINKLVQPYYYLSSSDLMTVCISEQKREKRETDRQSDREREREKHAYMCAYVHMNDLFY